MALILVQKYAVDQVRGGSGCVYKLLEFSDFHCDHYALVLIYAYVYRSLCHLHVLEAVYIRSLAPPLCVQKEFVRVLQLF